MTMPDLAGADGFELSMQQEMLWSAVERGAQTHVRCTVDLPAGVAPEEVRGALEHSVRRHEALRTVFARPAGLRLPLQVIAPGAPFDYAVEPAAAGDAAVREQGAEFDHAGGPLLRGALAERPDGTRVLTLAASALVADVATLLQVAAEVSAHLAGRPAAGEPLQYADYAAWQREQVQPAPEPDAEVQPVGLPFLAADRQPMSCPADLPLQLRPDEVAALRALAGQGGHREADAWLAVWLLLAARLTGSPDLAVSVAVTGRGLPELADAAGPYELGLAVRCPPAWDEPFPLFLGRVTAARAGLEGAAAPPPAPPLPFGFAWRELPPDVRALRGAPLGGQLELEVCSAGTAVLRYDPVRVEAGRALRVAAHLAQLLAGIATAPDAKCGSLEVLPDEERGRLLAGSVRPAVRTPAVTAAFERHAAGTPDAPAVVAADATLTYGELDGRANALAHLLRAQGARADTPVAICLDRTTDLIVAVLAVLKAGAAYLPLNPEHPPARLSFQLADAAAPVLLTTQTLLPPLADCTAEVICLDRDGARIADHPRSRPQVEPGPDDLAYVIYTSGSTGTPKGVAVRHGGLTNYTSAIVDSLHLDERPLHFALVTTVSTDLGNTALFPALTTGGCLHLVPVDVAADGAAYAQRAAVDVLKITPSHLGALLAGGGGRVLPRRHLVVGGEALAWTLADQVTAASGCTLTNHYGPTETTVGSLACDVRSAGEEVRRLARTVPIGRPLAGTSAYVVDAAGGLAAEGVVGELWLGGAGLARGYCNAPELTADRFVPDPFAPTGGRVYRTGDLVRWLPDGSLEFVGRDDDQVKVRGFRVELGEVQAALERAPGVRAAAVLNRPEADGTTRIVAYVVGEATGVLDVDALRREVSTQLPAAMVPAGFVPLERLPLDSSGKLDRRALPDPDAGRVGGAQPVQPRTDLERRLAAIWSDVLGLETVGVCDDFFGLGGHSLLATQVLARIRGELGVHLPLPSLFLAPTVEALARLVEEHQGASRPDDLTAMLEELEGLTDEEAERLLSLESERPE
jgi:amino acid adenylation domain-containing protein